MSPQVRPRRLVRRAAQKTKLETAKVSDGGGENSAVCSACRGSSDLEKTGGRPKDIASMSSQPWCERAKSSETDKAKM